HRAHARGGRLRRPLSRVRRRPHRAGRDRGRSDGVVWRPSVAVRCWFLVAGCLRFLVLRQFDAHASCKQEVALMLRAFLCASLIAFPAIAQTPPPDPWSSSIGAGVAITSGNSDTQNVNISASTTWDPKTDRRFKADALYLLGETNGEKQVDRAAVNGRYERLF